MASRAASKTWSTVPAPITDRASPYRRDARAASSSARARLVCSASSSRSRSSAWLACRMTSASTRRSSSLPHPSSTSKVKASAPDTCRCVMMGRQAIR